MDFHIDRKTGYLLVGTLIIGMIIGAWLSNLSMHHHMSRMMRGGDMGMMMHDKMTQGGKNSKGMRVDVQSMDQSIPAGQVISGSVQAIPEPQMIPVNN